jgi:hypothetical protein
VNSSRQVNSGEQLWLDKAIERNIDLHCRISPNENIFQQWQRQQLSTGVMVLIDASESANDRIEGSFTSILDLEKKLSPTWQIFFNHRIFLLAYRVFSSNTKDDVKHYPAQGFCFTMV